MTMVPARAALPSRYTGLALGYRVLDLDGAEVTPFATDGVIETAPGHYWVAGGIDAPPNGGLIVWGTKERPNLAQAEIEPLPLVIDPTPAIAALGDRLAELIASLPQPVAIAEIDTDGLQEAIAGVRGQIGTLAQNDAIAPVLERLEALRAAIVGDERFEAMRQQVAAVSEAIAAIEPPVITTYPPADLSPLAERLTGLGANLARVEALVQPPPPATPDVSGEIAVLEQLLEAATANHKERVLAPIASRLEREVARAFRMQGQRFVRLLGSLRSRFAESSYHPYTGTVRLRETLTSDDWLRLFDEATGATTEVFFGAIQSAARAALTAGAQNAIADVGIDSAFTLRNPRAVAYLQAHGYGLISQIDSVTRGNIATIIDEGVREGWSYSEVAREISRLYSQMAVGKPQQHIESRAHLIAVTEAGQAYEEGNLIVVRDLQDAGLRMEKKWLTVGDDRVSAGCRANEAEGWIPLERSHRSGDMRPLRFPSCRCTELYQRARSSSAVVDPVLPQPATPTVGNLATVAQPQDDAARRLVDLATDTMSQVHRLPSGLPALPVNVTDISDKNASGLYVISWDFVGAERIDIDTNQGRQEFTFLHEFGHYLDHQWLGLSSELGELTRRGGVIQGVDTQVRDRFWQTVKATPTIADMEKRRADLVSARPLLGDGGVKTPEERVLDYQLQEAEIWARSYAQWISARSGRLSQDVERRSAQWPDDEFGPVANVIDRIFAGLRP